jgi:uncharacterized protein (TIGR02099 family)
MTLRGVLGNGARSLAGVCGKIIRVGVAMALLAAACVLGLRFWFLPNIDAYREQIAAAVSNAAGQKVTITRVTADWAGLRPRLNLNGVAVLDASGEAVLKLARVDSTLSWLSVPFMSPRFHALDFYGPALDIRRDKKGAITVAGIALGGGEQQEGGFSDWVLAQRDIEIHDGAVDWTDELRGAPTLKLRQVGLHLVNRGTRHRFGLKAVPPVEIAGALDVRGDFTGRSLKNPADWKGRIYMDLPHANIAAWRTYAPLPIEINRGEGALRAWAEVADLTPLEVIADVTLAQVRARLNKTLPELDLSSLSGRVGWRRSDGRMEFFTRGLTLVTQGDLRLPATDFQYVELAAVKHRPASGSLKANVLDIVPLASIADHLPIEPAQRARLLALAPKGKLTGVALTWEGAWPAPEKYQAQARFEQLAINRTEEFAGLSGITGRIEATEKGGTMQLDAAATKLDLPQVFKSVLVFDTLKGEARWKRTQPGFELKLANVRYANADLAGELQGSYKHVPGQPGIADFSGALTRADARQAVRYLPLPAARNARPWLEGAFLAGSSDDVKFRLKGDLRHFPFVEERDGIFTISAKVKGATVHYGDNWPNIERIDGDLLFRGRRMEISASQGFSMGARLSGVRAEIADLAQQRLLTVAGDAEGQTTDFLKFISASPVSGFIDRFTEGMQAEGAGRLRLRLDIPLLSLERTRVAGGYQFLSNKLQIDPAVPVLEQVTGRLDFSETGFNVPSATAVFLGGPLTVAGSTQRDGSIRLNLTGRLNPETLLRAGGPRWLAYARGSTDWQGTITVRKKTVDAVVESNLQGLAMNLPAPLLKTAAESLPLRVERRFVTQDKDQYAINLGDLLSARFERHVEANRWVIDRGAVRMGGGAAPEPPRAGVMISGALRSLDADAWMKFLEQQSAPAGATPAGADVSYTLAGLDVKVGDLKLHERKFTDIAVAAGGAQGELTRYRVTGREVEGTVDWNARGRGAVMARLKTLILPAVGAGAADTAKSARPGDLDASRFPALDVIAENFQMGARAMGKLELRAVPQDRDWRIEQLRLTHADSILTVDGLWRSRQANPHTHLNVHWAVLDAGKAAERFGFPGTLRRGRSIIAGTLDWNGSPLQIDYPSLSGKIALQAVEGQFAKMEPGLGKLLGIISLQSLPRRLTLDFRDVFSDGYAFDEILSEVNIERGVATTDRFVIAGPAAKVLLSGSVDIARETQNLQAKVSPRVSDGAALATALIGGPIAVVASFVASKIFKDPLDDLLSFRYTITGSWADPQVAKVGAPKSEAQSATPQ